MRDSGAEKRPEIVIGLVGAVGADLDSLSRNLIESLKRVKYRTEVVHLSRLLHRFVKWSKLSAPAPEDERIKKHQDAGNRFREATKLNEAMALLGIQAIAAIRRAEHGDFNRPIDGMAYVIRSLKSPNEVRCLRDVYGPGFFLIGAYAPHEARLWNLEQKIASSKYKTEPSFYRAEAEAILSRDRFEQGLTQGQNVENTFPEADIFVDVSSESTTAREVSRFVDLLFGAPFITPTPSEYSMFLARAAALRSADVSRQVGAVIATERGDIVAVGTNEVPRAGGGMYWPDDADDARDFQTGENSAAVYRQRSLMEILDIMRKKRWLAGDLAKAKSSDLFEQALKEMKGTRVLSAGEYARTVHAEMAALADAARRRLSAQDCILYCTTFPCHNCAKHLIAAGIGRVVYIDPYPKSLAIALHRDALQDEGESGADSGPDGKVRLAPFVGVAPRRYMDLFTMGDRKGDKERPLPKDHRQPRPRYPSWFAAVSYTRQEQIQIKILDDARLKKRLWYVGEGGRRS